MIIAALPGLKTYEKASPAGKSRFLFTPGRFLLPLRPCSGSHVPRSAI